MRRLYRALPAVLVLAALGIAPVVAHESDALDCSACHVCDNPTATDPCLKAETCPRHELSQSLAADLGPEIVILDQLEDLYVAVRFDHHAHAAMVDMGEGCETCHHFSPPNSPHPSCRECHPANIQHEDLTQPGLKGAYHRQCMGCHSDWDHDTKCEVCHAKKAGGRLHGTATTFTHDRHYEPIEMKELIIFETGYEDGDTVPFHHRNHAELYEVNCALCHEQQSCAQCHVHGAESHPLGELEEVDLHDACYQCHVDQDCGHCHGRGAGDLFDHASTGWPLKSYHGELHCRRCHVGEGVYPRLDSDCATCHDDWNGDFDHRVTGVVLDEVHGESDCADCHQSGVGRGVSCDACHDDGRVYGAATGFGE